MVRTRSRQKREEGETIQNGTVKELTVDLIFEILLRLPLISLLRFKCVCRTWNDLISSPSFISKHYQHNHNQNKVPLLGRSVHRGIETSVSVWFGDVPKTLTFDSSIRSVDILGCLNGVVCLSLSPNSRPTGKFKFVLWNPATRQDRVIVSPMIRGWSGRGFFSDPVTNAFKVAIVKFNVAEDEGESTAHVHMFSTVTNSWTEKNIPFPHGMWGRSSCVIQAGATFVNRYMHFGMAIFSDNRKLSNECILSYDMIGEVFKRIEMPFQPTPCHRRLSGYEGSIFIFDHGPSNIDVWVMNYDSCGTEQPWYKLLTFRAPIKVSYVAGVFNKDGVDWVALNASKGFLYLYNLKTREGNKLSEVKSTSGIFQYRESLASLK